MTPNSFMMTSSTAHIVTESESEPKFCVCLQVQKTSLASLSENDSALLVSY